MPTSAGYISQKNRLGRDDYAKSYAKDFKRDKMELTKEERVTVLALMSIAVQQMRALHHYKTINECETCGHLTKISVYNLPLREVYEKLVKKLRKDDIEWGDIENEQ